MKRYGRTVVGFHAARRHRWAARSTGSDFADYAGNCSAPVVMPLTGVRSLALHRLDEWETGSMDHAAGHGHIGAFSDPAIRHVDYHVRCRKCPDCLRARAFHWTQRATHEVAAAQRTWFCTFTLTAEQQSRCRLLAIASLNRRVSGTDVDSDSAFKVLSRPVVQEFQRFMKRLRKQTPGLRYVFTIEKHTSGLPHGHALIHETAGAIRHADLTAAWTWGFSKFKLVPDDEGRRHARYVCKYLTKSLATRVCASRNYGNPREG